MADITLSDTCTSLDPATKRCTFTGKECPFAAKGNYRECLDATFRAEVVMAPDEFHVLLDCNHQPTVGTLPIKRCRVLETHKAAGVHVNAILTTVGREALLEMKHHPDGRVEYHCEKTEVALQWRNGKFSPVF